MVYAVTVDFSQKDRASARLAPAEVRWAGRVGREITSKGQLKWVYKNRAPVEFSTIWPLIRKTVPTSYCLRIDVEHSTFIDSGKPWPATGRTRMLLADGPPELR